MSTGGAFGGARSLAPRPPEKGVFPLDHFHECKKVRGVAGCDRERHSCCALPSRTLPQPRLPLISLHRHLSFRKKKRSKTVTWPVWRPTAMTPLPAPTWPRPTCNVAWTGERDGFLCDVRGVGAERLSLNMPERASSPPPLSSHIHTHTHSNLMARQDLADLGIGADGAVDGAEPPAPAPGEAKKREPTPNEARRATGFVAGVRPTRPKG